MPFVSKIYNLPNESYWKLFIIIKVLSFQKIREIPQGFTERIEEEIKHIRTGNVCAMGQRSLDTTCRRAKRLGVCFGKFRKGGRGGGGGDKDFCFSNKTTFWSYWFGGGGGQTVIYKGHLAQMDWWKIDTEFSKFTNIYAPFFQVLSR